jgi:fructoselysine-6-P-deglycase FrlB-like protein
MTETQMRCEVLKIPAVVQRLLDEGGADVRAAAKAMRALSPGDMISVARGLSDQVGIYLKDVSELLTGTPISSVGPSIALRNVPDEAEVALADVADQSDNGASVFARTDRVQRAQALPIARPGHPLTDPIALVARFYALVEQIAVSRGINPDAPRHMRKATETR